MEKTIVRKNSFYLAAVIMVVCIDEAVGGSNSTGGNKPVVKTIKSEDGDIIDCVDIFHQPAFDHPLLKNHTIQMWPSDYPTSNVKKVSSEPLQQLWQKSGSCPQGTVPIRRTQKSNLITTVHDQAHISIVRESAGGLLKEGEGPYYGASGIINIWNVPVESFLYSSASVFVNNNNNFINAGWTIYADHYGDNKTRFYTYWTADGGVKTGCYDLSCSGFIQVDRRIVIGGSLSPISTYDGPQYTFTVKIYMDRPTKNWWLVLEDVPVGYWPISIFTDLKMSSKVQWMGQVANGQLATGLHINTPMGSGHSPSLALGKAAFFKDIMYVNENGASVSPGFLTNFVSTNPNCYYAQGYDGRNIPDHGFYFFYGGPQGVSSKCK